MTPDYYYYLNQSGTYKVDGTNDSKDFQETMVRIYYITLSFFFLADAFVQINSMPNVYLQVL